MKPLQPFLPILALAVSACSETDPTSGSFEGLDSAGVRIVESHTSAWEGELGWQASEEPILQIGEREGSETSHFFNIRGGLRMSDGRIVILNSGSHSVRIFGDGGDFISEFGGSGEGPGEFRSLGSVHCLPGDTLLIWDGRRPGYSIFTSSGEFVRSQLINRPGLEPLADVEPLPDGRLVVETYASPLTPDGARAAGIHREAAPLFLFGRDGELIDTIGVFPSTETAIMKVAGQTLYGAAPFPKAAWVDVSGNSVIVGTADGMEVSVLSPGGAVEAIFRYPEADLLVRQEDRGWWADRITEAASTPREVKMLEPLLEALVFSENRAAYSDIKVDPNGSIWLRTGREFLPLGQSTEWTVFSGEGVLLGSLQLPERFTVLEFGNEYVLGVWRDEYDVEYVRVHELVKD